MTTPAKRESDKRYRARHKTKIAAYLRKWRAANRDKLRTQQRAWGLASLYDMTEADYVATLAAQGGVCAICRRPPKRRHLHVDHDHRTGVVRGILCPPCNTHLGWYELHTDAVLNYLNDMSARTSTVGVVSC